MSVQTAKHTPAIPIAKKNATTNPPAPRAEIRRIVHERCRILIHTEEALASGGVPFEARSIDVSSTGLGVMCENLLTTGRKVILSIFTQNSDLNVQAVIRWAKGMPTSGRIIREAPVLRWRLGLELSFRTSEEQIAFTRLAKTL